MTPSLEPDGTRVDLGLVNFYCRPWVICELIKTLSSYDEVTSLGEW